jgi:hypothetical protein
MGIASFNIGVTSAASYRKRQIEGNAIEYGTIGSTAVIPDGSVRSTFLEYGLLMGKNSSTSKWYPIRGTTLSADEAQGQTVLSVTRPGIFQAGDNVKIVAADGTPAEQDLGAVVTVGASTITVTNALTDAAGFASADWIYWSPATDYTQDVAVGVLMAEFGVDMLNPSTGVAEDKTGQPILIGFDGRIFDQTVMRQLNSFAKAEAELESAFGIKLFY